MNARGKPFYTRTALTNSFIRSFLIVLISLFSFFWLTNTVFAATQTVLEKTFVRETGKPETQTAGFMVPVAGEGKLKIVNGPNGGKRISSAVISLNGTEILGPDKFNQNVGTIEVPVNLLKSSNTLSVKLNSAPGGSILIQIIIEIKDPFQAFQNFKDTSEDELIVLPSGDVVEAAKDQIVVSFKEDITSAELNAVLNKITDLGGVIVGASKALKTLQVSIPSSASELAFISEMEALPGVSEAFLNMVVNFANDDKDDNLSGYQRFVSQQSTLSVRAPYATASPTSLFDGDYWINHIHADKAWVITTGSTDSRATIGIVDSGVSSDQHIFSEPARLIRYNNDGDVIFDDDTRDVRRGYHGTWVTGFAAGFNNSPTIRGMAWVNNIRSIDVMDKIQDCVIVGVPLPGTCFPKLHTLDVNKGIEVALSKGASIVNVSIGLPSNSVAQQQGFRGSVNNAVVRAKELDSLVVFASGNENIKADDDLLPSDPRCEGREINWCSHVLRVGASNENYEVWDDGILGGSNMGKTVDILAPGEEVGFGDALSDGTTKDSGTSLAAPLVTGTAALVRSINPTLSAPEVRRVIIDSADPIIKTTYEPKLLLDAEGALNIAESLPNTVDNLSLISLTKGETKQAQFDVTVPETTVSSMDVLFLIDTTGSYGDDINSLQLKANEIITNLSSRGIDVQFGVASFADFPFSPYGDSYGGDKAYYLNQPITSNFDAVKAGIESLDRPLHYGADGPESQLEALYQAATGQGRDLNGDGLYSGLGEIEPSNVGWRTGALQLIILATDAPFHDSTDEPGYPGASFSTVETILKGKGTTVIGLDSGSTGGDLQRIVSATGGSLFALSRNSAEIAEVIAQAITNQLRELNLSIEKIAEGPWVTNIEPPIYEKVAPGQTRTFTLTLTGLKNIGTLGDQNFHVYLWVKGDNSAIIKRVHIPITVPLER